MKCDDVRNNLSALLDNELPEFVYHDVMRHLQQCPDCSREKERLAGTINLINTMEIPLLSSDIFGNVAAAVASNSSAKSYNVFTRILMMVGILMGGAATIVFISPFGRAFLGLVRAFSRHFMGLGSMLYKISSGGFLEPQGWLTLTLFLAFLFTFWLMRRLSLKSGWGGPVHE